MVTAEDSVDEYIFRGTMGIPEVDIYVDIGDIRYVWLK